MQDESSKSPTRSWLGKAAVVALVAGASAVTPLLAHHSFAGFDKSRKVTISGTVRQWQFTNPHSWLQLLVVQNGREVEYSIEGASVNTLIRRGWSRTTFRPGERVSVEMYPLRSGRPGGAMLKATFANGRSISTGITPN
jgi:hypothetical protein